MADQEDDDFRMALRMSLNTPVPEAKRSKPRDNVGISPVEEVEESPEAKNRRQKRELMLAAAEKRMSMLQSSSSSSSSPTVKTTTTEKNVAVADKMDVSPPKEKMEDSLPKEVCRDDEGGKSLNSGEELSFAVADQLFTMVFGDNVSRAVLAQWTNQGIRFSADPETSMGLVQHEGGPCGVLATIQAFVLKYLLFYQDDLGKSTANLPSQNLGPSRYSQSDRVTLDNFASLTEDGKARALVRSMVEILFMCGSKSRAVIATFDVVGHLPDGYGDSQKDEVIAKSLEGLPFESTSDLQKVLRVNTYTYELSAIRHLETVLPLFRSRLGALLFLVSALLSRGLESVQEDRDDPSLPLVTAPFGHASQEIVNLLLCGQAVPNVFDGRMDLGGGMSLKGIPLNVEVGFLTLLESLNFCKVGQHLKCPKWPIWVVGSESHYTVLFSFDTNVQTENEYEARETQIRKVFDSQDQSGGGGFISVDGLQHVLRETKINLPQPKLDSLAGMGFVVWSEFWQVLLELEKGSGGLKDSSGMMGKKVFDLYHFNGIAKSIPGGGEQRPRLSKLRVSVPPKWTPEEFMVGADAKDGVLEITKPELPPQHAPLVDCVRTRWARAVCNWVGDPPSIV
ncbi:hypothetical protein ACHQM5_016848 [Ranunculus cassubicifolius]